MNRCWTYLPTVNVGLHPREGEGEDGNYLRRVHLNLVAQFSKTGLLPSFEGGLVFGDPMLRQCCWGRES